jgi:putative hemolysin
VFGLVAGNAFFVIGEYAVVTARRGPIMALASEGRASARAALRLMDDPVRVISTVQVGITALGILAGAVGEPLVREVIGDGLPHWLAFVLGFGIVTYLSVVLGELVPKALTLHSAERLVVLVARPVELMAIALKPVVWVLQGSAQAILRPFGIRDVVAGESIRSPEELRAMVDEAQGAGIIPRAQEELLHAVFDFATPEARDVMVPAAEVEWLAADTSVEDALAEALRCSHSRYPVGRGSVDRVIGVVHLRELAAARQDDPATVVESVARSVPIVAETKDLGALLREMREQHEQLAVVADEYGGTVGIVTIEDILEEIVGEIEDEYDLPDDTLVRLEDGTLRVAGSMTIDDFNEMTGAQLEQRAARTLAGVVFNTLGRGPEVADRVLVDGVSLEIEELSGSRITRLKAHLTPGEDA